MNLTEALGWLDRHINRGVTLDKIDDAALDDMRRLMTALGEPQLDVPVIQVTGTNGKGSTAAMIGGLLTTVAVSGLKGLFESHFPS